MWSHFPRRVRKKALRKCGAFLFYFRMPEPGPVGVNVDPLGEALGPRELPDGLAVLLGLVAGPVVVELPALPVVVPFMDQPVGIPLVGDTTAALLTPIFPTRERA